MLAALPRRLVLGVCGIGSALAPAACRSGPPEPPRVLTIAYESPILSLDPVAVADSATHAVLCNFYDSLVRFDPDMRLTPALAVQWNTVDERTWVIEIRPHVRFHDGRLLTAADVKYSLERARDDPKSGVAGHLSDVVSVEVAGPLTLQLRTRRPDPLLMNRLSYILILPRSPDPGPVTHPTGTGPYRFVGWSEGQVLEAEAFPDYWNGPPPISRVRFVTVEEGEEGIRALNDGRVDVLRWVPETLTGQLSPASGVRVGSRPGLSTYYLWPDSRATPGGNPFADFRVRRALSLAIDRQALVTRLGGGVAADQYVQQGVFGYVASLKDLEYDPAAARELLRKAGHPRGFDATLALGPQTSTGIVAGMVQEMLGQVGVRVRLVQPGWRALMESWKAGRVPFFLAAWRFETGDAASFLRDCLFTRDPERNTGSYNPGYSNPALDRMIEDNVQIFGEVNRLRHYEKLMRLVLEEMPLIPLYHRQNLFGIAKRVRWEPRLDGKLLAAEMSWSDLTSGS